MRHLPRKVEFPQPTIADSKTARMMIRNQALCRAEVNGMTTGILLCRRDHHSKQSSKSFRR